MATETTNYKFKKPDNTDFYNIADQNGNWDKCDKQLKALDDGKAATTHEHTKAEITDFPISLPADGGDADTVGGLPPSAFLNVHSKATDITWDPTTYPLGCWSAEGSLSTAHGHPVTSPSLHITYYMTGQTNDANGYRTLLAITADGRMFLKVQQWAGWSPWIDLKDANTLGGKNANQFVQWVGTVNLSTLNDPSFSFNYEGDVTPEIASQIGLNAHWWHVKYQRHTNTAGGYGLQMFYPLEMPSDIPRYRTSSGKNWDMIRPLSGDVVYRNKVVTTASWVADNTYNAYGYTLRAPIECTGASDQLVPYITFAVEQMMDENIAPITNSYSGGVAIYAKTRPTANITIPEIRLKFM